MIFAKHLQCSLMLADGKYFVHEKSFLCFRVWVYLQDGIFQVYPHTPTGWTHIVVNYIRPDDGQGIRVYFDGLEMKRDTAKYEELYSAGSGSIIVGRLKTNLDKDYISIMIDELIFFNSSLDTADIRALFSAV